MAGGLLIVGASQAGVQLAVTLRALGDDRPITLLGDEDHRPYQRPALSKEFLQGRITKESVIFRAAGYWDEHDIDVVQGERITGVLADPDGGGTAISATGRRFPYDRLALTVGARARRLDVPGSDLDGVLYLRNADDALALAARVGEARDVVVVGGGFIGLEAAASLTTLGKTVTVVEAGPRLLERAVGPQTSAHVLTHHLEHGIHVLLDTSVTHIEGAEGRVTGVATGGTTIAADLVVVGIGVLPNTELAEALDLHVDNGITVDCDGVTSDGRTLAIGDVANVPTPGAWAHAGERIRFESVNNAVEQAKVAAHAIVGRAGDYAGTPWFWSNQGGLKIQIAGISTGHDRTVVRHDPERGKFSVLYFREGRIIAADAINTPLDFMAVKAALAAGGSIDPDQAADPGVPLKSLISRPRDLEPAEYTPGPQERR